MTLFLMMNVQEPISNTLSNLLFTFNHANARFQKKCIVWALTIRRDDISVKQKEWATASILEGRLSGRLACIQKADNNWGIWSSLNFIIDGSCANN